MQLTASSSRWNWLLLLVVLLGITVLYTLAGGVPPVKSRPVFVLGVVVVLAVVSLVAAAGWHLLIRPLTAGQTVSPSAALSNRYRIWLGVLIGLVSLNHFVGGTWDEVWHYKYGLPFGVDFFWPPHLLIYSFLGVVSLVAFLGLYWLNFKSRGTLQQRFRANPIVGLLILLGGFLIFTVPADPLWHSLYGEDISAWSLPHIILLWGSISGMFMVPALLSSTIPQRMWGFLTRITLKDLLILLAYALMMGMCHVLLTTEWDGMALSPDVARRPVWLLPANLVFISALMGSMALHSTRRVGVATATAVLEWLLRFCLLKLLNFPALSANAAMLGIVVALALDIAYAVNLRWKGNPPVVWLGGVAAALGMIAVFPVFNRVFPRPLVTIETLPSMLVAVVVVGIGAVWAGRLIGSTIAPSLQPDATADEMSAERGQNYRFIPLLLVLQVAVLVIWILNAPSPTSVLGG